MIIFKALSKQEFAEDAGISMAKLREWTKESNDQLQALGVNRKTKMLPPAAVKLLAEKYQVVTRNAKVM